MNLRLEGFRSRVDRVREWRLDRSIGTNQRFWSVPGKVLDLPIYQLGTMWDLRQLMYANIEEEHRWLAAEAFFGISAFLLQTKFQREIA